MSEQSPGQQEFVVPSDPSSEFAAMLDFLVPPSNEEAAAPAGQEAAAPAAAGGQPAAPAEGAPAAGAAADAPAAGDGGQPPVQDGAAAAAPVDGAGAGLPDADAADVTGVDAATLSPQLDELATSFETRQEQILEQEALQAVQTEYGKYFDALRQHPRQLVGQELPSLTGSGMDRLRDSADAKDWQDAVKQLLINEIASRVETRKGELADVYSSVHSSIDLFRNNADLIPGTRQFDKELAEAFTSAAKDYEQRVNGKLIGYSVPVQPIINALRSQITARRSAPATPPAPATPTPQQQRVAEQPRTPTGQFDGPQAGITSKAGQSSAGEDDVAAGVLSAFLRQNGVTL